MRRPTRRRAAGHSVTEFIIVFPLLMLVFVTIMQLSLMYTGGQVVQYAAHAAARSAIVYVPANVTTGQIKDPPYQVTLSTSSDKYARIKRAAELACVSISPPLSSLLSQMGALGGTLGGLLSSAPSSVESTAGIGDLASYADQYAYANRMTVIRFQRYDSQSGSFVDIQPDQNGVIHFTDPGGDVSVLVEHQFYLRIPLGGLILFGNKLPIPVLAAPGSTTGIPVSMVPEGTESLFLPGRYMTIQARSTLPLQGELKN